MALPDCKHHNVYPSEWRCEDCLEWFGDHPSPKPERPLPMRDKFRHWWKTTPGFDKCNLRQAVGAYVQTYPGRAIPLLIELLHTPEDPVEEDVPPPGPRSFVQ